MEFRIDLVKPDQWPLAADLMLQSFSSPDNEQIQKLVLELAAHPAGHAGCGIMAWAGDTPIGFVQLTQGLIDTFTGLQPAGVLGPLGVLPDWQRRGVGRALVARLLIEATARNYPYVFLEGDPAYYSRLNFVEAKPLGFRKPSIRIPDAAFQCFPLATANSEITGTFVYPEPFWTNDCVGLRHDSFIEWLRKEVAEGRQL